MAESLRELLVELESQGITGAKRYKLLHRHIKMQARKKHIPVSGTFELTPLCNLDCKMCYVHLDSSQMNGLSPLSIETWLNIAQQAVDAGLLYAIITGGECLTYPHFKEFYLFLRSKGIEITLKTNGLLLEGELLQFIIDNPPALVNITMYGASDEGYEAVTGHRVFDKVLANVLALQQHTIPISISITPNGFMQDSEDLLHILHDHNLIWNINPFLVTPNKDTGRDIYEASLATYASLLHKSRELLHQPLYPKLQESDLPSFGTSQTYAGPIDCAAGRSSFSISWKGELSPCISFPEMNYSILDSDFSTVWNKITQEIDSYPAPVECTGCSYQELCTICIVCHITNAPKGHANRSICEWTKCMVKNGILSLESKNPSSHQL